MKNNMCNRNANFASLFSYGCDSTSTINSSYGAENSAKECYLEKNEIRYLPAPICNHYKSEH
ncbi:hypothetical protein [Photobacterium sp. SKA34]|uniref:hypothetical protein n=1 Tax=Photobacterium sp. SKA34 TaxID=121723 RepID=UPI000587810B|nr:hypothetical protein [Photobacterium sp. SKA34]